MKEWRVVWRCCATWLVMLLVSVANGAGRDLFYAHSMSELAAHQLSTLTSMLLLGAVMWFFMRLSPPSSGGQAVSIGLFWLALTVAFEFIFFHFIGGHSWSALLLNYNILQGRVWIVLLLWIALAPFVFYRLRRHDPCTGEQRY